MSLFEKPLKLMKIGKKFKKIDFFKMSQLLTPTIIIQKTHLGKVVSLLKGLERYFNAEDEKNDFLLKIIECQ